MTDYIQNIYTNVSLFGKLIFPVVIIYFNTGERSVYNILIRRLLDYR